MPEINIILGPPGTGKTENLLRIVDQELKNNTGPDKLAFVSFTTKATNEARDRAKVKFNYTDDDLPYFRTLHSFGKRQLNMANSEVMRSADYKKFAEDYGVDMTFVHADWDDNGIVSTDNVFLKEYNKSRMKMMELDEYYNKENLDFSWQEFLRARNSLEEFKHRNNKSDFTDMLSLFVETGNVPELDVVIVDEAQDLSLLQWKVCEKLFKNAKRVYISGDDDQAIFRWAGADVDSFITQKGKILNLTQSYRIPRAVHDLAMGIVKRISNRIYKEWKPRTHEGMLSYYNEFQDIDMRTGNWLVLARTRYMLNDLENVLYSKGLYYKNKFKKNYEHDLYEAVIDWEEFRKGKPINYDQLKRIVSYASPNHYEKTRLNYLNKEALFFIEDTYNNKGLMTKAVWYEAFDAAPEKQVQYIRKMRKNGEILNKAPRILLSTIHGVKGGEADNVVLLSDLSNNTQKNYERYPDDENRLFYVGATRAKHHLHIVKPKDIYKSFRI